MYEKIKINIDLYFYCEKHKLWLVLMIIYYFQISFYADSIQILFIKSNMIDLVILAGFIYLVSRVCLAAFDSFYSLFSRGQSSLPKAVVIAGNENKKDEKVKKENQATSSPKTKNVKPAPSSPEKLKKKTSGSVQRQTIKVNDPAKSPPTKPSPLQVLTNEINSPKTGGFKTTAVETKREEEVQSGVLFTTFNKEESINQNGNKDGRYELEIESLRSEIQRSREEKKVYISQIEDIIQQITRRQVCELTKEAQTDDSLQLQAIQQLRVEVNNSRKGQILLLEELRQGFEREKDNLKKDYELKVIELQGLISLKETKPVRQQSDQLIKLPLHPLTSLKSVSIESSQISHLEEEFHRNKQQLQNRTQELSVANRQLQQTIEMCQGYQGQISELKQKLVYEQNNQIEISIKFNSAIESLQSQKEQLENDLSRLHELRFKDQQEKQASLSRKDTEGVERYENQIEKLTRKLSSEQREKDRLGKRVEEVQEELKFCQTQIQTQIEQSSANQTKLREEVNSLRLAQITPKLSLFQVQNHPDYQKLQLQLQSYQRQLKEKSQKEQLYKAEHFPTSMSSSAVERKINYARPTKERDPSPLIASSTKIQVVTPPDVKTSAKLSNYRSNVSNPNDKPTSAIFTEIFQRKENERYKTPFEKPSFTSSIREGSNVGETYFGQTNILTEEKRSFVIAEINRLKKIGAKKTKLMYRSLAKNTKPISESISNVPNLFVVVELANKKILGAFTQTAFATKENSLGIEKSKYIAQNKSMIMDISEERVFANANASTQDTIKYDQNALVWGRYEFVVSFAEPLLFSSDLNCENAIYPCVYSNPELLGCNEANLPISHFEVYRIFLG